MSWGCPATRPAQRLRTRPRGDPSAAQIVDDTARSLAYVVACVVPLIDPALIVLGGAIGANGDLLLEPVVRHLADFSDFRPPWSCPTSVRTRS